MFSDTMGRKLSCPHASMWNTFSFIIRGFKLFSYKPFSNKILSQKYLKYISYQIETEHMCEVNIDNGLKFEIYSFYAPQNSFKEMWAHKTL